MRAILVILGVLLALPAAAARSLAVLPLDQGAKSEEHEGLGRALAGMLISDLARVESLELVERGRLDAILKEVELGASAYIDPQTAVKVGNGVGAEWVVVGSWSVVGKTFLMDARTVDVKTGKILVAVDANGTLDDFLTVEKTLVESLLAELAVEVSAGERRKIIAEAATESFDAMSDYGAGLQAEFDGDYEAAKKRFQAAAQRDPAFELPLQRLTEIRSLVEKLESERIGRKDDARSLRIRAALEKSPDEMQLKGRTKDRAVQGQLEVRWALLQYEKRWCQMADEMRHYLVRHDGKPLQDEGPSAYNHRMWAAHDLGLFDERPEIWDHGAVSVPSGFFGDILRFGPSATYTPAIVAGTTDGLDRADELGDSLVNVVVACAGPDPAARLAALEGVQKLVTDLGVGDMLTSNRSKRPLWTKVEVMVLEAMVAHEGMTARAQARLQALLEFKTGADDDDYAIRSDTRKITGAAERFARFDAVRDGTSRQEIMRIADGAKQQQPVVLALSDPGCKNLADRIGRRWPGSDQADTLKPWDWVDVAENVTALHLAGCVIGKPGELGTLPAALAWVDTLKDRRPANAPEKCDEVLGKLADQTKSYRTTYAQSPVQLYRALVVGTGMNAVRQGCALVR